MNVLLKDNNEIKKMLGKNHQLNRPTGILLFKEETTEFSIEHYTLKLNDLESVPAIHLKPNKPKDKQPVVIFLHSHGGNFLDGKSEVLKGAEYLVSPSFAKTLTGMGYDVWSIDSWGFEDRRGIAESELFKEFLLQGMTLWGMRIFDVISLIDYLFTRNDVDVKRIATIGMSMGGMLSWWVAALDKRIKVCVDIAGQVNLELLAQQHLLDKHGFYLYMPNFLKSSSTIEIQKMIFPRARLSLSGIHDPLCPYRGAKKLDQKLKKLYLDQGYENNYQYLIGSGGHQETFEFRATWINFLKKNL